MRKDMSKVLALRGRGGGGWKRRGRQLELEDLPLREPMSRGWGTKYVMDNLSPLARYLDRQVGRRWDDVYSEISEQISSKNAVQRNMRERVFDLVDRHVVIVDGQPCTRGFGGEPWVPIFRHCLLRVYVDPSGVLRANPIAPRRKRQTWIA